MSGIDIIQIDLSPHRPASRGKTRPTRGQLERALADSYARGIEKHQRNPPPQLAVEELVTPPPKRTSSRKSTEGGWIQQDGLDAGGIYLRGDSYDGDPWYHPGSPKSTAKESPVPIEELLLSPAVAPKRISEGQKEALLARLYKPRHHNEASPKKLNKSPTKYIRRTVSTFDAQTLAFTDAGEPGAVMPRATLERLMVPPSCPNEVLPPADPQARTPRPAPESSNAAFKARLEKQRKELPKNNGGDIHGGYLPRASSAFRPHRTEASQSAKERRANASVPDVGGGVLGRIYTSEKAKQVRLEKAKQEKQLVPQKLCRIKKVAREDFDSMQDGFCQRAKDREEARQNAMVKAKEERDGNWGNLDHLAKLRQSWASAKK